MDRGEYIQKREAELRESVEALVSSEEMFLMHVRNVHAILTEFRLDMHEEFVTFKHVESETDHLPTIATRHLWSDEALAAKDLEVRAAESFYRVDLRKACLRLLAYLEKSPLSSP